MAIQGIFLADFSQYNAAVDQADAKLRKFTSATTTHDAAVTQFTHGTATATNAFGSLSTGLAAADKTLAAFGVHIGPEIHALEEMSQAAGKTASQIGLIGTASLTAAAALGGFEIGKLINQFTGLDEAVSRWIDRTFDLAVAQQEAGAKQDVINRAIKNGADSTITYTEAVQFNVEAEKKRIETLGESAKAQKKAADEQAAALEKERAATEAYAKKLSDIEARLFGGDAIAKAKDYMATLIDVKNVTGLNTDALAELNTVLTEGFGRLVEQGGAATDLATKMNEWRLAVLAAQQTHTVATTQMESDEARLARESDELARAMKENFVIIGQSAQEAAQKTAMSWNDAMAAVRAGQGTLGGSFQSVAPGTAGSSIRYDDYGNPYGYIPGVNLPGRTSPSGGHNIFVDARESMFDTPAGMQRLAEKVVTALGTQSASRGGR